MPRLRSGVSACAAALLLAACAPVDQPEPGSVELFRPLRAVSVDEMCSMVAKQTIEVAFGVSVTDAQADERGRGALRGLICRYRADTANDDYAASAGAPLRVVTTLDVDFHLDAPTALDESFTDVAGEVVDYQRVAGLGEMAGFGPDVAPAGRDGSVLSVIFSANRARLLLTVETLPDAELAQLKPIAVELLAGLNAELNPGLR
ncbi:MAG: hypothetical protein GEU86_09150 [Actinophytocola sp.]|nr:hypothetical protein [Actinophytocola sp.]